MKAVRHKHLHTHTQVAVDDVEAHGLPAANDEGRVFGGREEGGRGVGGDGVGETGGGTLRAVAQRNCWERTENEMRAEGEGGGRRREGGGGGAGAEAYCAQV